MDACKHDRPVFFDCDGKEHYYGCSDCAAKWTVPAMEECPAIAMADAIGRYATAEGPSS